MDQHLDRMQRRVDELTRKADDLASMAADLHQVVGEMRKDAKQLPLPGIGAPESPADEAENVRLRAENRRLNSELREQCGRNAALRGREVDFEERLRLLTTRRGELMADLDTAHGAMRAAIAHLGDMTVADTARMRQAQRVLHSALGERFAPGQAAD